MLYRIIFPCCYTEIKRFTLDVESYTLKMKAAFVGCFLCVNWLKSSLPTNAVRVLRPGHTGCVASRCVASRCVAL